MLSEVSVVGRNLHLGFKGYEKKNENATFYVWLKKKSITCVVNNVDVV